MAVFIAAFYNTTPLGVGNWTSSDVVTDRAAVVGVLVSSDNNLTLNFNWSNDGISTVLTEAETITGGTPADHFRPIKAKYLNIELVNGGTNTALVVHGFFFSLASATLAIRNLGSGTPVANLNKLGLRSLKSSDASITISNTADEIDLVSAGGGTTVVSLDDNVQVTESPAGTYNVGVGLDTANSLNLGWNTPLPASGTNSVNLGYGRGTGNNSVCIGGGATGAGNTSNTGIVSIGSAVCPSGQGVNSVAIGYLLGSPANAVSTSTVAIGAVALASGSASTAVAIGNSCMSLGAGKNANNTVAIGDNCLFSASNSQSPGTSVFIGKSCASSSTSLASNNVFVGPYCCSAGTYGSGSVCAGYYCAYNKTVGANCVIIGSNTDFTAQTIGAGAILIGQLAGAGGTVAADEICIGRACAPANVAGRVSIGANAEAIQTTATAGAQTLPSNPSGFMRISHNGTLYKIPLYND